jgi:hypothetical protein
MQGIRRPAVKMCCLQDFLSLPDLVPVRETNIQERSEAGKLGLHAIAHSARCDTEI